jgi:hypothetical protein
VRFRFVLQNPSGGWDRDVGVCTNRCKQAPAHSVLLFLMGRCEAGAHQKSGK